MVSGGDKEMKSENLSFSSSVCSVASALEAEFKKKKKLCWPELWFGKRKGEKKQNKNTGPQRRENRKGKEQNILYTAASQLRREGPCHLHSSAEVGTGSPDQVCGAQTFPFLSSGFLLT